MLILTGLRVIGFGGGAIFEMLFPGDNASLLTSAFMILQPQARRQKEHTAMIEAVPHDTIIVLRRADR